MMLIIYKLIVRILAEHVSPHCARLINLKQTRFIPGRYILENIFLTWLMHYWVLYNKILVLFIKLDFEKAYDRVKQAYIWEFLCKVGLGGHS